MKVRKPGLCHSSLFFCLLPTGSLSSLVTTLPTPKPDTDPDFRLKNRCHLLQIHIQLYPPESDILFLSFINITHCRKNQSLFPCLFFRNSPSESVSGIDLLFSSPLSLVTCFLSLFFLPTAYWRLPTNSPLSLVTRHCSFDPETRYRPRFPTQEPWSFTSDSYSVVSS